MPAIHDLKIIAILVLAFCTKLQAAEPGAYLLQEGDIVFSSSAFGQGAAIIAATASPYTHCGIVFKKDGKLMVLEAVQPVGVTTLENFMSRGQLKNFTARRLKSPVTQENYQKARAWAETQIGRNYDVLFRWDDEKLYCSELVWKIYQKSGIELCPPRHFKDYDLKRPEVRKIIDQRYGGINRLPMDEKVVAPSDLAASQMLVEVPRKASKPE